MKTLRYYQKQALVNAKADLDKGIMNLVVQMPTGTGKSLTQNYFTKELAPIEEARTIFIGGFKRDLCVQAMDGYKENYPECVGRVPTADGRMVNGIGLVMGNDGDDVSARILITSAQTVTPPTLNDESAIENELIQKKDVVLLPNGGIGLNPKSKRRWLISPRFDRILQHGSVRLWLHDEAHHAPADSTLFILLQLREIYKHLGLPKLINIGFTATPMRNDGVAMSTVYERITYRLQDKEATEQGFILPVRDEVIRVNIMDEDKTTHKFKAAMNWTDRVIEAYEDHLLERDCVAFFVGPIDGLGPVQASRKLREAFQEKGYKAVHIDAGGVVDVDGTELSNKHRKRIYNQIKAKQIRIICNFDIVGEGIDLPIIDTVAFLRKVNEVACTQIIGRARRRFGNQTEAWVMDFTNQTVVISTVGTMTGTSKDLFNKVIVEPPKDNEEYDEDKMEADDSGTNARALNTLGWVQSAGNVYDLVKLQRRSKMMWYLHSNSEMSMACARYDKKTGARGDALLVTPPDWNKADLYAELLETDLQGDDLVRARLLHQVFSNFTLWHTRSLHDGAMKNGHFIRYQEIVYPPEAEFTFQGDNMNDLEEFAQLYAEQIHEYDESIASKKNKKWRKGTMTDKQLPLFKALWPDLDPSQYSSGEAGQLITFALSSRCVHTVIDMAEESLKVKL